MHITFKYILWMFKLFLGKQLLSQQNRLVLMLPLSSQEAETGVLDQVHCLTRVQKFIQCRLVYQTRRQCQLTKAGNKQLRFLPVFIRAAIFVWPIYEAPMPPCSSAHYMTHGTRHAPVQLSWERNNRIHNFQDMIHKIQHKKETEYTQVLRGTHLCTVCS